MTARDHAIAPPRRARAVAQTRSSVPASPPASPFDSRAARRRIHSPRKTMGDATQVLVGVINNDGASAGPAEVGCRTSLGANKGGLGINGERFRTRGRSRCPAVTLRFRSLLRDPEIHRRSDASPDTRPRHDRVRRPADGTVATRA